MEKIEVNNNKIFLYAFNVPLKMVGTLNNVFFSFLQQPFCNRTDSTSDCKPIPSIKVFLYSVHPIIENGFDDTSAPLSQG